MQTVPATMRAAIDYAARGWAVIPVAGVIDGHCSCGAECESHPGKHPLTRHGLHDGTTDPGAIQAWWRRWPWANVAIVTGAKSGLVVLDIDPDKGGRESWQRLRKLHPLPETVTARTGGGGWHLLYRHPGGRVRNTSRRLPALEELWPGLDVRGDGGFIVAPPSRHISGRLYQWREGVHEPAAAPWWLHEPPRREVPVLDYQRSISGSGTAYGFAALEGELRKLRRAQRGDRSNSLNRAAFSLGTLVGGGELGEDIVTSELLDVAVNGLGLRERESLNTINSGMTAGKTRPRAAPDRSSPLGGMCLRPALGGSDE